MGIRGLSLSAIEAECSSGGSPVEGTLPGREKAPPKRGLRGRGGT